MKKIFFIILTTVSLNINAQIALEHSYDSASTLSPILSQLMIVKFEVSGYCYVNINRLGKYISVFNLNHSLIKTISLASIPSSGGNVGDILYLSENLFNTDSKIEFMVLINASSNTSCHTYIYNEDGVLLFSEAASPLIRMNVLLQQYPIYNTPDGTKMILSYPDSTAKVFSLPGTLSEGIANANNNLIAMQSKDYLSNPYPNPTTNSTKIDYTLPDSVNEGEIVFYNLQGMEVKRFKVDKTFSTLLVSTTDIAAGTYLYQLQTSAVSTEGKKMVVIK